MPGAYTHLGFAELLAKEGRFTRPLPEFALHPQYAAFGSLGPDFLFFHPDDWPIVSQLFEILYPIYDAFEEIFELYEEIAGARERVLDWVTGGLYGGLANGVSALKTTLLSLAAKLLTEKIDFFDLVTPPFHTRYTENHLPEWWWIDLGHHVRTGDFLRNMWANSTSPELRAYCGGYASHIAADVIGHPYVNTITGGPYRNHWRRHVLVERCLDTFYWNAWYGSSVSNSLAHRRIEFEKGRGGPKLAGGLVDLLSTSLTDTYGNIRGPVTGDQVSFMYHAMHALLERSSSLSALNLPPPEPFDWFDLPDFIRKRFDDLNSQRPPVSWPSGPVTLDKIKQFLLALARYGIWLVEYAVTVLTTPLAALARLSTTQLRYLLWLAMQALYEAYRSVRLALAMGGYVHPEYDTLTPHFRTLVFPSTTDWNNMMEGFPWQRYHNERQTYHLVHPSGYEVGRRGQLSNIETPATLSFQTPASRPADPLFLFAGGGHLPQAKALFQVSTLPTIGDLRALLFQSPNAGFVTPNELAIEIVEELVQNKGKKIPNWNLDGDRGYGWPTWRTGQQQPWNGLGDFRIEK